MKEKLKLPNVTIICVAGNKQAQSVIALYKCLAQVEPSKTVLLTNINISCTGIEVINVGGLNTWELYNRFLIKELTKYFTTDYCLVVQWDGYILDAEQWDDKFYDYDYIGAKWLDIGSHCNVGNGGFSLRSKRLQDILAKDDFIYVTTPEDNAICKLYRPYLEEMYQIKYAPEKIADKFSFELNEPLHKTFGFHAFHWPPHRETVVLKRAFAMGDVITLEPILEYYHKKGFQVSLDTHPDFQNIFIQHYFPVVPREHLNPHLPVREIDLNSAYEIQPKKNHLESYYDFCEVPHEERIMRNTRLNLLIDGNMKLFKKYCILHIDERNEAYRNIYGIKWKEAVNLLNKKGYIVIQLGNGKHEIVDGAIEMKTPVIPFLKWVVAASDLFIGIDSGIAHIASGFDIPSIIFFGSVDPAIIYYDLTNKICIHNHDKNICQQKYCWHNTIGETGTKCYIDNKQPPCTQFETIQVLDAINKITNSKMRSIHAVNY